MESLFFQVLQQSIAFLPLAFAIYLSFSVLKIPDLTVEGSFVTGAAIFSKGITFGMGSIPSFLAALLGGAVIGMIVSFLQKNNRIQPLIAGVLMIFILSSINLLIMDRPNISLLGTETMLNSFLTLFSSFSETFMTFLFLFLQSGVVTLFLYLLLKSRLGLYFRAFGDNSPLLYRLGNQPERYRMAGLCISNTLAAYAGILAAQLNGYADISMGFGFALVGIGTVIIGGQLFSFLFDREKVSPFLQLLMCFAGIISYFFLINFFIRIHINPIYLKVFVGIFLILFLLSTKNKDNAQVNI